MCLVFLGVDRRDIMLLISIVQPVCMLFLIQSLEGTPQKIPPQGPVALLLFHNHGMRMCDRGFSREGFLGIDMIE